MAFDLSELDELIESRGSVRVAAGAFALDYLTNMQAFRGWPRRTCTVR